MSRCRLTPSQGVSSLSLNSGTINISFTPKQALKDRRRVVDFDWENFKQISYTLPYLFQSYNTSVSVCDSALTNALKYTHSRLGTHPNFPPFPLCHSRITEPVMDGDPKFPSVFNPATLPEGYPMLYFTGRQANLDPIRDPNSFTKAGWLTQDWSASVTAPDTLVKTVSSGTM